MPCSGRSCNMRLNVVQITPTLSISTIAIFFACSIGMIGTADQSMDANVDTVVAQCHQDHAYISRHCAGRPRENLWGGAQLQVLHIVCCKVFNDFLCDACKDGMVCGDLMNDPKQLENLA